MPDTTATIKAAPKLKLGDRIDIIRNKPLFTLAFPVTILVLLFLFFGIGTGGAFFSTNVLLGVFNQALIIATIAIAVSFIYTTGNLDISVGNVMGLSACLGALVYNYTESVLLMVLVAIAAGTVLMLFNSTMSVVFGIKTITVAIVMIQLYSAIVSWILGPNSLKVDYSMAKSLENDGFRYIAFIAYFVACYIIYHHTTVGRQLRFVGGNESCAEQTGMSPKKAVYISFLIAGVGIGLAATFSIIRTGAVSNETGNGMGMDVMLATVLGGMSIFGGAKSNSYSGVLGAMTVSILNTGMLMMGISSTVIQGVRGVIFLLLVFLNSERPATLPTRQQV